MDRGHRTPGQVQRITLPNGLVLVHEHIPSSPAVAYHLWIGAGSAHETEAEAGAAHYLEHMLFKGTERRDSVAINDEVEKLGGNVNAFTTFDHTAYHLVLASRFWRQGLDILLDMVFRSKIEEEEVEVERLVILEEIREGDDSPEIFLGERFFEALYAGHPYGRSVIGTAPQIQGLNRNTILGFYERWYRPQNMVLAVAGNIPWTELVDQLRDMTGDFAADLLPKPSLPPVVVKSELVYSAFNRGQEERVLEVAFPIPGLLHEDIPALDLLGVVLGGGETSRLYREFRLREQLARTVSSSLFAPVESGKFVIHALPFARCEEKLVRGVMHQIRRLQDEEVSGLELMRAKMTLDKELIFGDETVEGRAKTLGYFQSMHGSFEMAERYRERLLSVTERKLQNVAQKYLDRSKVGIGLLLPKSESLPTREEMVTWVSVKADANRASSPPRKHEIERWTYPNGVRVVARHAPGARVSSVYSAMIGGQFTEDREKAGISHLAALTVDRGTEQRTDEQIAEEAILLQAEIEGLSGKNVQTLQMDVVSRNLMPALEMYEDVFLGPLFEEEMIEQERTSVLRDLETQKDYFEAVASNLFLETMYPNHPYGLNPLGTPEALRKLNPEMLRQHYQSMLRPEHLVIGVAGDFRSDELRDILKESFGSMKKIPGAIPASFSLSPLTDLREVRRPIQGEKAYLQYGFRGGRLNDPDRFALDVLSAVLASSGGGRLYVRLREELGLVYSVDATVVHGRDPGFLAISLNTTPDQADRVVEEVREQLGTFCSEGVSEDELTRVKNFLVGSYEIDLQRSAPQAIALCLGELYGTDRSLDDYSRKIMAVTAEEVQRAAVKHLTLDHAVMVLLSPMIH